MDKRTLQELETRARWARQRAERREKHPYRADLADIRRREAKVANLERQLAILDKRRRAVSDELHEPKKRLKDAVTSAMPRRFRVVDR